MQPDGSRRRLPRALLAAAAVAALAPLQAQAVNSGQNGEIAFERIQGGTADIYVINPDGSDERRLSGNDPAANDTRADWAPYPDLTFSASDGSVGQVVTIGLDEPTPGRTIVGVSFNGAIAHPESASTAGTITVTVPPGATSGPVCVGQTYGLAAAPAMASWSESFGTSVITGAPPGPAAGCRASQPIAFQSDRRGDYDLWAVDPQSNLDAELLMRWEDSNETTPVWAPTSDRVPLIAFVSDRRGNRDLYLLDASRPLSRTNPMQLTRDPGDDANPDWSIDGSAIAFDSDRDGEKGIWVIERRADGRFAPERRVRKLTVDQPPSFDPSWFRFGIGEASTIAFSGSEGNGCEIEYATWENQTAVPIDLGAVTTWTAEGVPASENGLAWSPLGDQLTYHRSAGGNEAIFTLVRDNGFDPERLVPLTAGRPGRARHPAWRSALLQAGVSFWRPLGRSHRRKKKRRRKSALVAVSRRCAEPPAAWLRVTPRRPRPGRTVRLSAKRSVAVDGGVAAYEWDLDGDGSFERRTTRAVVRGSFSAGVNRVAVRVVDASGSTDTARRAFRAGGRTPGVRACTKVGTAGADRLYGTSRRDVLCGRGGDDLLIGRGGADRLRGGPGRDLLYAGRGHDRLRGGRGRDELFGDEGRDRLLARDGRRDDVDGGPGRDNATVDRRLDAVARTETVRRR
jgi:hemolysin type calcium-binding protein/WD40 repeat protein